MRQPDCLPPREARIVAWDTPQTAAHPEAAAGVALSALAAMMTMAILIVQVLR